MKKELLCTFTTIAVFTIFNSCSKLDQQQDDQQLAAQHVGNNKQGMIYIESNAAGQNSILSYFQNSNGTLTYFNTTASGGAGSGSALGSQGALALDETHHYLYAVNAGSNSISVFSIAGDGALTLTQTISSNGTTPVSLSVFGWWLYVVNAGSDNISGFNINSSTGQLSYIPGSDLSLSGSGTGPAQIQFTPDRKLIVTEKNTNKLITFPVSTSGLASAPSFTSSTMPTPFGFAVSGNNVVVAHTTNGMANNGHVSTYKFAAPNTGTSSPGGPLAPASPAVCAQQTNAARVVTTKDGKLAYITNFGSNSISSFKVDFSGNLQIMNSVEATTGSAPTDITFNHNESYIYTINAASHTISEYKKSPNGRLSLVGQIGGLPANAAGLVAL
jgi:6-phosphogluconolactonase